MGQFAVIDTETNWNDKVMSIGTVIADTDRLTLIDAKYHVLTPEYLVGGMYDTTLFADPQLHPTICSRAEAMTELKNWFAGYDIHSVFAYNANFDRSHLPELGKFVWYDIMRLAAYRQYNHKIPATADCFRTGKMKRGYGVEPMLRILSGRTTYHESHNALYDAMDELEIIRLPGQPLSQYIPL